MNNRSAFRRFLANRKYRQSILRNMLRGIFSNRLIDALIPKWSAMSSMIDESKRGVRTLSKNVNTVVTPLREMMKPRNDRQHAPLSSYRLCLESLEDRRVMAAVPLGDIANIGTELNTIVHEYKALQASSITDTQWSSFLSQESSQFRVRGNSIYIEARGQGDFQAWKDNLSNLSFNIIASVASAKLIEGFVPIANLGAIANAVGTISVLPIWNVSPTDSVGTASNAAETTLKADSGSRLFGVDGTGITVGVISDSANQVAGGLNASKTSNNLNASAQVLIDNPGTDEGRAMMELIQDIAPAATLKFASGGGGEAAFATAVNTLVTAGSNVIVDDLNLLTIEPYFYDGVASQSVTSAVTSGVTYFASAGNRGIGGFEMPYTDVNNTPAAAIGNGTYHDFDSGVGIDATQTVTLQPGTTTFVFQWDQFWGTGVTTDMDFYVLNAAGTAILTQGTSNNVATQVAREIVSVSVGVATTAQIAINRVTGPAPGRFKYIGLNSPTIVEHTNETGALVNPINPGHSSNANAISIAAANVGTPTTVASYSSRGPATRTLSPTGTAIPLQILYKPDFTSNDGAQTSVPGFQPFFGTSAAAPNAAGVAALLLDYNPALTPAQIRSALLAGVIDINTAGYDLATGNGLIDTTSSLLNLSSGVLTIDGDVGATNDNIIVKVNSSDSTLLDITINGTPLTPIKRTLITSIQINGKTGSDKLTIDLSSGNFIPAGGISFAGGESAGDDDQLVVTGYNVTNVTVNHTGPEAGNINLGGSTINFSEIEPLALAGSAANLIINLPAGPNNAVLGDDTNANFPALGLGLANTSAIDAPTFEYTSFTNPTNSLTVNLGPNGDTLTMQSLDAAFAAPSILIQGGALADVISVNSTSPGVATSIASGGGDDRIVFTNGVSLNGGTVDGGAGTGDTIDYSAYTTNVSVNLGSNAPGGVLAGVIDGGQENPGQVTTANGTVSITNYNSATKTFDISAHVSNLAPGAVTGYHIHRAPVGVNGPIILNLSAIFGLGALVSDGLGGFDFNAIGVSLPAQHEAAFLGGITYFNVHTAAAPSGLIRGQLFPTGVFVAGPGTATGTGGVSNIENATGGIGADSLVGDLGINVLRGGLGNDTIVGAPGDDTLDGGDNNDVLVWSNGDNNDIIDGGLGADVVQVNGSVAGDDVFTTSSNAARITFARSSLVPFTLDIGTTETLISNGIGGNDTMTVNNLAGVSDLTAVNSNGFAGNDSFNITASPNVTNNVNGLTQVSEDVLVYSGPSPATKTITGQSSGSITAGGVLPVNFISIENLSTSPPGNLFNDVINLGIAPLAAAGGQDGNPNQVLLRRDATNTFLQIFVDFNTNDNGGIPNPVLFSTQTFTSVGMITVDGGSDNDTLVIDQSNGFINRAITFNGGGQTSATFGDVLRLTDGSFTTVTYNHTNANSGNVNVDGTTYTYTGLEPIFDNMNAVNRVFNFNNVAQTITIEDDLLGGNVAGMSQAASPGQAEIVFFSNPTGSLTVNGGTGGNIVRVFPTIDAAYATPTTTINSGIGVDEVRVLRSATATVVNINMQAGLLDRTVVGADAFPVTNSGTGAGTLNNILGVVNVADSGGSGELFVDASADAAGTYNFTATKITRGAVTVNYNVSIDPLHLATGNSADVVNVTGTTATTNTIFTNGGDDEIRVTAVAAVGNVHIETGAGVFDRTVIGATSFAAFNTGTGSLSNVQGTVNVNHNSNSLGETYIDNSGDATNGRVFNFNDVPGIPFFATQGIALTSNFMAGAINVANNASDFYQFADGSGASTLNINATADSGNADSSIFGNVGSDLFVINGDGLGDDNLFLGGDGTDQFFLNVAGNIGNLSTSGINSVRIDGNAASDSVNRDQLVVNDNSGTARSLDYLTMNTQGDFNIAPNGAGNGLFGGNLPAGVVQVRSMETYVFNSTGVANDTVRVFGATDNGVIGGLNPANDDITVALLPTTAPVAGPNSPLPNGSIAMNSAIVYRNGAPYIGTPPVALVNPANLPGVSGGGLGTDFLLNGIAISGLTLDGNGNAGIAGDGDRAIVYAASENPLVQAGNATNIFGLGAGILQPGFGVGKAFDTINTTDGAVISTNSFSGQLASVLLNTGSFVQSGPANSTQQAALIVNGGDEVGVQGNNIADSITATLSTNFNIQINGNLPGLTFVNPADKFSPRQGDQLQLNLPPNVGSLNIFSDGVAPVPNVSVGASNLTFVVRNSSIEIFDLNAGPTGTVNIIGDNNDAAVTQNDYFRVRGRDVDSNNEGVNELQLELGGNWNPATGAVNLNSPIFINNVTRLNVSGGNAIGFDAFGNAIPQTVGTGTDALDITAYADNTPRGWGVETYFNEGDDAVAGDGGLAAPDLLIFNGVLGVSEKIVVQPSSLLNGQVFSNNAATNTPIAVVNYMLNSHIVVNGSSPAGTVGDTDSLTLRGTNAANPGSSGNEDVVADFTATGTAITPLVRFYDAGPAAGVGIAGRPTAVELADTAGTGTNVLYNLQNVSNFNTIGFELLDGSDVISLIGRNDGSLTVDVDGGSDSFADGISIPGVAGAADQFIYVAGNLTNAASVFSQRGGALGITRMNLTGVDNVSFDGGGGAGTDILRALGSPGVDSFIASANSAIAGQIAIGSYPAISYANLGTGISRIILVNDGIGSGSNLDSALIQETAVADANVWTPASNTSGTLDLTTGGVSSQITLTGFNSTIVDAKAGVDSITTSVSNAIIDQGTTSGSGTITATNAGGQGLLPLGFRNVESSTVTGGTVVINGTEGNDTINVSLTGVVTVANAGGVVLQTYNLAGANALVINSIGGDDSITIASSALFLGGIQVISGDNGNGSDTLNVSGADLVIDLEANKVTGVVGGPVSFNGIEHLNVTATATITINGKSSTDLLTVTPTGVNTTRIVPSVGGLLSIETNNPGTLTIAGVGGIDSVVVNGTSAADTINVVKGATTTVAVGALKVVSIDSSTTENVSVNAGDGVDTINLSGTTNSGQIINITGGSPTSNAGVAADTLNITMLTAGTTAAVPGATPDAGVITSPDGNTFYSGIELFSLTGAVGANTLNSQGTHNNDTMALQFLGGANRIWINDRAVYTFANFATVNMNGLFGDDKINVLPIGLVGVTTINVAGGNPTTGDELVVSGSSGNDVILYTTSDTVGSGSVAITGAPVVNFTTTESLVLDGLGGTDNLTHTTPVGGHRETFTPGTGPDSGTIRSSGFGAGTQSVPLTFTRIGALGTVTFAGAGLGSDILEVNGTNNIDTFNLTGTTVQILNATGGFTTIRINTSGVSALELRGLDGDDTFNVSGSLVSYAGRVLVDGGNPSASDVLHFTGTGGAVTLDFNAAKVTETGSGTVVYSGIEVINVDAVTSNFTVQTSASDAALEVTPTGANAATFRLTKSNPFIGSTPVVNSSQIGTLNVNLLAGNDELVVIGSIASDAITVTGALVTVGALETVNYTGAEALSVFGKQGSDTFTVTPGATPIFIDGGDPIGILPGDQLIVNGGVGYFPGPENDEGGVITASGPVSFDHIESLTIAGIVGCPFLILGTNGDDDITVIARDASTTAGADGVQDFTFSINQGINVVLLNQADLFIDAMAGDDDIVIRTAAPNEAAWDVNVRVAGGSPSIGAPLEADRLVLETPNGLNGFDDIVFNPTGNDTGNLVIDKNANGTYDAAGTDSLITFGSFVMVCPPANFTYTSTAGGVELIQVNGEGAPAIDDNLTINGTALDDTTVINPTGIGTGTFASGASPQFIFQSFDNVTVNPGSGGFDRVEINGTAGPDTVTSNANTVTLGGAVTLGAGIDQVDINTLDGNDNVTLTLAVTGLKKVVNLGAGNDRADLSGVAVDPADPVIYGGDGDDNIIGSPNPDLIFGGSGTDVILGLGGIDYIDGGDGNDTITGGTGDDTLHGGAGSDVIIWNNGDNTDVVEGGTGDDRAVVNGAGAGDVFTVFANATNPSRIAFNRTNLVPFGLDIAEVEEFDINSGSGADNITVGDLTTTALRELDLDVGVEAGIADTITVNGRNTADQVQILGAGSVMTISGLRYEVRVINALAADADDFTFNANGGDDSVLAADSVAAFFTSANTAAANHFRLNGGDGQDRLEGYGSLDGQAGNDTLTGSATIAAANGNQLLIGGDGDDTMVGGAGADTFDGGIGFDTIRVRGTLGNDVIDISQTADVTLVETVNGVVETDTLVLVAGTRTVERVSVVADAGNDTIRVQWADSLGTDANVNSLRVDVNGGAGSTGDRLGVVDLGTGDLILYERGTTNDSGAMAIGPGNPEPLIVNFADVEIAQPIAGSGGDVVVFKHDPFEFNNARTLATYLGANEAINVDPTINPGLDPAFGFPADEDWYRVVAEKTGVLDFQVYFRQVATVPSGRPGLPNAGNLDIEVTDAAGNVINGFGNNDNTNDERARIPAIAGQTYYLRVFANGNAINTYNITVANYVPPTPRDMELLDNPVGDPPPANSDTGRSQFDNITRDNTPTLVFRLDDAIFLNDLPGNNSAGAPPDEVIPILFQAAAGPAGYRIAIFDEGTSPLPGNQSGTAPQTPIGFATLVGDTNNNGVQDPGETVRFGVYQFTTPVLTDGSHFLTARVQMVDPATPQQTGFGDRSVALEIVVDTVIPPAFFGLVNLADSLQGMNAASDRGVLGNPVTFTDRVTSDTRPSFYGRAEANTVVRLYVESNGTAGLQTTGATPDLFLGLTTTTPLDGTNQFPGGQWSVTTPLDLNNPALGFAQDGLRIVYLTGEDVAGNTTSDASADVLNIFLDSVGPQITSVQITGSPAYNLFGTKPGNALQGPTPAVNGLTINVRDLPNRSNVDPNFLYPALEAAVAATPGNFVLKGDHNGIIAIQSIVFVGNATSNGNPATGRLLLTFFEPLPDDRFTLTVKDTILDPVGNRLDGDSNAAEPSATPSFPTGDRQSGGVFVARFTVDSRPEIGVVSEGIVYVDINGNYVWDPEGKDRDATNRDLVFQFGQLVDAHFAGNFAPVGAASASGYDKLGAYGKFAGTYSFVLDTNDDGVADFSSLMPAAYQVNGIPVAGNFNAAHPGDEIGVFDGSYWYLDTNGNNQIDLGERFASNFNGLPVVGDFDGNGTDDLAAFNNATNTFTFDTNRDGIADYTWRVADDIGRFVGLSGFTDRPVAGDLNLDGIDDIGLWVKDRQGTLPQNSGEYFFWVSDRANPNPALVFDSYSPDPLGNDLFAKFGDDFGLPILGNFDPPVGNAVDSNPLHNTRSPYDVDSDGSISPLDVLIVINVLNNYPKFPSNDPVRTYYTIGQQKADPDNDRTISPLDALSIINYLNRNKGSGEGEADGLKVGAGSDQNGATDDFFAQLGADLENDSFKRKRR